jgi:hypothetical protein
LFSVPSSAEQYGLVASKPGGHTSRTMMLAELGLLFAACPPEASPDQYRNAIVDENVLLKPTQETRIKTHRYLRQLYGLDSEIVLFRVLRLLWPTHPDAQPLLALLTVLARDPILRCAVPIITSFHPEEAMLSKTLAGTLTESIHAEYPSLTPKTAYSAAQNCVSTWTQSGHLTGYQQKRRSRAHITPTSTALALLIGHLCGLRGEALLASGWAQVLDAPAHTVREHAVRAAQEGWLEYRHAGDVTDITFRYLLGEDR